MAERLIASIWSRFDETYTGGTRPADEIGAAVSVILAPDEHALSHDALNDMYEIQETVTINLGYQLSV